MIHCDAMIYPHSLNKYRCIVLPHVWSFLSLTEMPSVPFIIVTLDPERSSVGIRLYGPGPMSMKPWQFPPIYPILLTHLKMLLLTYTDHAFFMGHHWECSQEIRRPLGILIRCSRCKRRTKFTSHHSSTSLSTVCTGPWVSRKKTGTCVHAFLGRGSLIFKMVSRLSSPELAGRKLDKGFPCMQANVDLANQHGHMWVGCCMAAWFICWWNLRFSRISRTSVVHVASSL